MFANISIAFLLSLGIALVLFFVAKGLYSRFSPGVLHLLVAVLAISGSTVAGTVAITSNRALDYVESLESGARNITGQVDALQSQYGLERYGISASDIANGYVEGAASLAREKLGRARTLSIVVAVVLNILLGLFLVNAASKAGRSKSSYSYSDSDDLEDLDTSSSLDDLDLD